ncbi:gamma-glutamyltranspeptidase [Cantharellus anzutake]|uniref:gamma-glutamyltranspeptidase n=1 Tax=Cantharellus anzutake TaxID=1750568 RepID=UPI0019041905|nr:gamma-glutamyltranspeptidase [Cantharellus anzutake]KAF8331090.1 gamma-glutamyltranspeptidase [Cantharellus anzutake]
MYPPGTDKSRFGGLAVGVPGELRGLWDIHSRWGKLKWRRLVEPSITMARSWKVRTELSRRLKRFGAFILDDPDWATTFAPNGKFLEEGDVLRRPAFAKTLESIADGVEPFYTGAIGDSILRKIASKGGIMTAEDLASYKPIIMPALEGSYRGRKIYTTRAPSSGPALLHILNILETFDLVGEGRTGKNVHRLTEALKFGFAGRTRIADPQFMVDTREIAKLATKEFGRVIAANLTDDITHDPDYYHPKYDVKEDHGTTHTSVVDSDGLVVGITSSINLVFGSRVLDPHTGIILNDEMDDFSVPGTPNAFGLWPSPYNYPEPGKRPLSSIAPIIMEKPNGYFHLVAGGSGGSRIFGSIVQTILNVDWGMDVSAAVEQARVHDQLFPRNVSVETTINDEEVLALEAAGHRIDFIDIRTGVAEVQAIHAAEEGLLHGEVPFS